MRESTALLITEDWSLIRSCEDIVKSLSKLRLAVVASAKEAQSYACHSECVLFLFHLVRKNDVGEVVCLLREIAATKRSTATLVLSEQHHADEALQLLRQGVADYLSRPLDLNRLAYLVDTLTVRARYAPGRSAAVSEEIERAGMQAPFFFQRFGGMGRLMKQVQAIAIQETTVLLDGETGTGKTRLASLIHELSPRRNEPFLVVNCGALAANLIESEMFGHVRGAFTGADRDRTGKFAEVGRGTLLLDEIDSLPETLQAKLLRAVEERVFEPVGSNTSLPLQARLIAASNRPLAKEVAAGRFRSDLYYRLNVVGFYLPPLRERRGIIHHLVTHFIAHFAARNNRPVQAISSAALDALECYDWPGNIRELRNAIDRAVTLCLGEEIQREDLPEVICPCDSFAHARPPGEAVNGIASAPAATLGKTKQEAESERILEALHRNGNNRLHTAMELGISRMTLYNKLHKYGLMKAAD